MTHYVNMHRLRVDRRLYEFVETEALPGTGIPNHAFWSGFDRLIHDLTPRNTGLLERRDAMQRQLDEWHRENRDCFDFAAYKSFLQGIGYLEADVEDFQVSTANVDDEIALQAGPQLVVPVNNARYALNAANSRWAACTTHYTARMQSAMKTVRNEPPTTTPCGAVRSLRSHGLSWTVRFRSRRDRTQTR